MDLSARMHRLTTNPPSSSSVRFFAACFSAAFLFDANASITAFMSNGTTCNGTPIATSTAITPSFKVSLCITSTEPICGYTATLQRNDTAGIVRVKSLYASHQNLDWTHVTTYPYDITSANQFDIGATTLDRNPIPAGVKILLATYSMSVIGSKPATNYGFRLGSQSVVITAPQNQCAKMIGGKDKNRFDFIELSGELPISATFTLKKK